MKKGLGNWNSFTRLAFLLIIGLLLLAFGGRAVAQETKDIWPKLFKSPKGTVIMYQPQLEEMKDDKITAFAAVSAQKKEWKQPLFGAVWLAGRVVTDRATRMASIDEVKVTDAKFPDAKPEQLEKMKTFLNEEMQDWTTTISLDRLLVALALVEKERVTDAGLKNEPPKIIFKSHPAVLVILDGEPKLLPIPDSKLLQVANTPFVMVFDSASKTYYLKGGDAWLSATEITGPWKDVETMPEPVQALADKMKETKEKVTQKTGKKVAKKEVEKTSGKMPEVIVSTVPAELLVTDGEPQYTSIKNTNLMFVSNTESNIFMDKGSQEYYILLSGRWFKSKSLQDVSWSYVAPDKLPGDFAKIPPDSAKGFVLVNVAGTEQAKEAVLDNYFPQTAAIDRKKAATEVKYAGDPKFDKIPGTNLEYAVNTGKTVFKEGVNYYALDQGVWYEANSPNGPWKVSVKPPQDVNKIPPSCPHYNAKYVKVYDSTDDMVYVGYTPGYTGSYVDNGTVVYGTGYDYPSYYTSSIYIPPAAPATYGYAATYDPYASTWGYQPAYYNPYSWLGPSLVGFGAGLLTSYAIWGGNRWYGGGWWGGGGYYYNNVNINHNYLYNNPWNPGNRWPGSLTGNPLRPTPSAGNWPNIYNRPGNQNLLASRSGKPAAWAAKTQVFPARGNNNVFADKNGNVYRRDNKGNWQQRQGQQWTKPQAAARAGLSDRDFQARQRGQMRTHNFQRAQSSPALRPSEGDRSGAGVSRPSGGGGRGHGGGGHHR